MVKSANYSTWSMMIASLLLASCLGCHQNCAPEGEKMQRCDFSNVSSFEMNVHDLVIELVSAAETLASCILTDSRIVVDPNCSEQQREEALLRISLARNHLAEIHKQMERFRDIQKKAQAKVSSD